MPNPFYIRPRSEFNTLGESRDHAHAVADATQFFGRMCVGLGALEASMGALYIAPAVLSDESVPFSAVSAGVLAVAFALSSRYSFVVRNRALMRATELPHEFWDVRAAELALVPEQQQLDKQNSPEAPTALESMVSVPQTDAGQQTTLTPQNKIPSLLPPQADSPRSAD